MAKILMVQGGDKNTSPRGAAGVGAVISNNNTHSSVFMKPPPSVDIILQNKMAVNSANYGVMNGMNTTNNSATYTKPMKIDPRGSDNFSNS